MIYAYIFLVALRWCFNSNTSVTNTNFSVLLMGTCSSNSININRRQYEKETVALLWLMLSVLSIIGKFFKLSSQKFKVAAVIFTSIPMWFMTDILVYRRDTDKWAGLSSVFGMKTEVPGANQSKCQFSYDRFHMDCNIEPDLCNFFVSTGSWLGHQLSVIDWISQVMAQERIDVETRKETGRCDQSYSCNPAHLTSCLLLTTIITVICKSKGQFSWVGRFLAPSVLCGVGVIYCSLLLHPAIGSIRMALSLLQLSSCRICPTDCHLRSRTVVFLKPICHLFRATKLSGSQVHRLKSKLK